MFRGIVSATSSSILLMISILVATYPVPLEAGSSARAVQSKNGKLAAPSKEDGIDYFAASRKDISPEDAKKADSLRVKTINSINALLYDKKNSKNEYELTLRLGELQVERADYLRDLEIAEYIRNHDKWLGTDQAKRSKTPPTANYTKSENSLYQAAQTFRKIAVKFPKHPRSDTVLYSLGRTLSRLNDDNASQYYRQLIDNHPKSKLIPDAWLALGELHFDKHRLKEATSAYQKVMDFKTHRTYPYAVYKLGWCFYNNNGAQEKSGNDNLEKALAAFQLVVKLSDKQKASNFNLRDEALRDLVMVFAELEATDRAWAYFKGIGEIDRFYAMLERLGSMYADAGKNSKALEVYTRLVNESPTRKNNAQIYQKMVELHDTSNRFQDVVDTVKTMQGLFVAESTWTRANQDNAKISGDAKMITERTMHRYGTMFHSRGQKIKDKKLESLAADIYAIYLQSFDKMPPAYDVRFYLADIQMDQKKYAQASANFIAVAKQRPKDGKYTKEAALNAVDAVSRWVQAEKFAPVPPPGQATSPIDIPKIKKIYADTLDFYVTLLPAEQNGLAMRYTAAQIYFDYGQYPEALKRLESLARDFSPTKQGQASARVIIAYYNGKTDWRNVIEYGKRFQANKAICQDLQIKKFIDDSLRAALFNSALAYEKAKNYSKAAETFTEFQSLFPSDSNADRALYNASLNQFKTGDVEKSLATQQTLLTKYPNSQLCPDVTASMAETYQALAQFAKASDMYKRFANTYVNDKRTPFSLYNAAVLQRGINDNRGAIQSFTEVYRRFPSHNLATAAMLESATLNEDLGDHVAASQIYAAFGSRLDVKNTDDGLFAQAKSIELRLSVDAKNQTARKDFTKLVTSLKAKNSPNASSARAIAAKILFNDQESSVRAFKQIQLASVKDIEQQAGQKQARLERLANAYQEIIGLGNPEFAVASYFRLGELHEDFAKALFTVQAPSDYSPKDASDLKSQLEKSAFPLRDQAYKFFETAYTQSSEVGSLSEWTQKTYQKMSSLAPNKHPEMPELISEPGYITSKIAISDATERLAH